MKKIFSILFLSIFLFSACSHKQAQQQSTSNFHYIDATPFAQMDFPLPPMPGSAEDNKDLVTLSDWQKKRTKAECARAEHEVIVDYEHFFGSQSPFKAPTNPAVLKFFADLRADTGLIVGILKERYHRLRPYNRDKKFSPCVKRDTQFAYPSGHTTIGRVFALVLGEIDAAHKQQYLERGDQIALDRIIAGVHHPSDIAFGKKLGEEIFHELQQQEKFNADLAKLKQYLK